jgi:predicted  nucleic acid-binding Zn-ribbon protein
MIDPDLISRLEREKEALESALAEFEHEARRVGDQLERRGGRGLFLEDRLAQLRQNITATRRDLERVRRRLRTKSPDGV